MVVSIKARLAALEKRTIRQTDKTDRPKWTQADLAKYRDDPVGFASDVLGVTLWPRQAEMLVGLINPPCRVLSCWGHSVGKTFAAAVAAVWWYYTRPKSVVITTAPDSRAVEHLLWAEIRMLVKKAGLPVHFIGPAAPEMRDPDDREEHWAQGFTASKGEGFQGRHRENMLFIFDEAEGLDAIYFKTTNTMFQPNGGHGWLAACNPTTTTSQRYQEEKYTDHAGNPKWMLHKGSCLEHPNIAVGLANREAEATGRQSAPLPYPNAITLEQVESLLGEWFESVPDEPDPAVDIEFPPNSGQWWRPGPDGESRVLGRNPSAGTFGVWSEMLWAMACRVGLPELHGQISELPEIGCDVARFGDDRTEIHTRHGPASVHHESHSGWDTVRTADRLMAMADQWAEWINAQQPPQGKPIDGKEIPIKVDDTGVGGGVTDILTANGYNAIPINAGESPDDPDKYPRKRDELWFTTRELARKGQLDLSRLPQKERIRLEPQALAPKWSPTPDRKRKVESKEETKKRIGRSPDGMDAVNLAYYRPSGTDKVAEWITPDSGRRRPGRA